MPPSKLDRYMNILEVSVRRPRKLEYIAKKVNMERNTLERHLDFLIYNGLVEERKLSNKRIAYAVTERGFSVFRMLRALRYLEQLKASLSIVEEAKEIAPELSKHSRKWKEE